MYVCCVCLWLFTICTKSNDWYNVLTDLAESLGSISSEYAVYDCGCSLSVPSHVAVIYVLTDLPESTKQ